MGGRLLQPPAAASLPSLPQPQLGQQQQQLRLRPSQSSSSSSDGRDHPQQQAPSHQHDQSLLGQQQPMQQQQQQQQQHASPGASDAVGCSGVQYWNGLGPAGPAPDASYISAGGGPAVGQQHSGAGAEAVPVQAVPAAPTAAHPPYPYPHAPPPFPYGRGGPLRGPGGYPYHPHHGYIRNGVAAAAGRPFLAGHPSSPYHLHVQHPHARNGWHHHPYGHSVYGHPHGRLMPHQYQQPPPQHQPPPPQQHQQPSPEPGRGLQDEQQPSGGSSSLAGASDAGIAAGRYMPAAGSCFRGWPAGQLPHTARYHPAAALGPLASAGLDVVASGSGDGAGSALPYPQQQQQQQHHYHQQQQQYQHPQAAWNGGGGHGGEQPGGSSHQPGLQSLQGQGQGQAQDNAGVPLQQQSGLHGAQQQQQPPHQHLPGGPLRAAAGPVRPYPAYPRPLPAAASPELPRSYPSHPHQPHVASADEGRMNGVSSWGAAHGGSGSEGYVPAAGPASASAALALSADPRRGSGGGGVWEGGTAANNNTAQYAARPASGAGPGTSAHAAAGAIAGMGPAAAAAGPVPMPVPMPTEIAGGQSTWPVCTPPAAAHAATGIFRRHSSFGSLAPHAAAAATSPPYCNAGGSGGRASGQHQHQTAAAQPRRASMGGWDWSPLPALPPPHMPPPQPSGDNYSSSDHACHMRSATWCDSSPPGASAATATAGAGPQCHAQPQPGLQLPQQHLQQLTSAFSAALGSSLPPAAGFTTGGGSNGAGAQGVTELLVTGSQDTGSAAVLSQRMSSYNGLQTSPFFSSSNGGGSGAPSEPQAPGSVLQQPAAAAEGTVLLPGAGCSYPRVSGLPAPQFDRPSDEAHSTGGSANAITGAFSGSAARLRSSSGSGSHPLPAPGTIMVMAAAAEAAPSPFRFADSPPQTFEDIKSRLAQEAAAAAGPAAVTAPSPHLLQAAAPQLHPEPKSQSPPPKRAKGLSEPGATAAPARRAAKIKLEAGAAEAAPAPQGQQQKDAAADGTSAKGSAGRDSDRGGGVRRGGGLPAPVLVRVTSKRRTRNNNKNRLAAAGSDGAQHPAPPPRRRRSSSGLGAGEDGLVPYREVYGTFHPAPYLRNKECIEHGGRMITRGHFERLGGTATAKWHVSIKVMPQNLALGKWLASHGLPVLTGKPRKPRGNEGGGSGGGQPRRRSGRGRSADAAGDSDSDLDSDVEEEMLEELEEAEGEERDARTEEEDEGTEERDEEDGDDEVEERWQRRRRVPAARRRSSNGGGGQAEAVGAGAGAGAGAGTCAAESLCPHSSEHSGGDDGWARLPSPRPAAPPPPSLLLQLHAPHAAAAEVVDQHAGGPLGPPPQPGSQGGVLRPVVTSPPLPQHQHQQHVFPTDSGGLHPRHPPCVDFPGFTPLGQRQQQQQPQVGHGHGHFHLGHLGDEDLYGRLYGEFRTTSLEESAVHLLLDSTGAGAGAGCGGDDDSLLLLPVLGVGTGGNDASEAMVASAPAAADTDAAADDSRARATSPALLQQCPSSALHLPQLPPSCDPLPASGAPASSTSSGSSGLHIEMPAAVGRPAKAAAAGVTPQPLQQQQQKQQGQRHEDQLRLSDALMSSFFPY
ncbi:hypothetical protein HXX76_000969 [Chlamydomonas incerta]|uniref:RegA n=1 Tax=Chlamydomonas incerta TaxID=51695 RepID=A0A835WF56_CHLIN|nr:hypothetical protein HXX76_000969 [Chlamydomonas incerta]|eukprot:KAG2446384.1 hypothetical protein HXX76_000969 [Chlamydomonas incerta]